MIFVDEYFFEFILLLDLNDVRKFDCIFLKIYFSICSSICFWVFVVFRIVCEVVIFKDILGIM